MKPADPAHQLIVNLDDTARRLETLAGRLRTTCRQQEHDITAIGALLERVRVTATQQMQDATAVRDTLVAMQASIARHRRGYGSSAQSDWSKS